MLSADYQKGLEKIVLERKNESMCSAWIGQLVAESLGGVIDSQKEIDLWLLHSPLTNKCEVVANIANHAKVVHTLMSPYKQSK